MKKIAAAVASLALLANGAVWAAGPDDGKEVKAPPPAPATKSPQPSPAVTLGTSGGALEAMNDAFGGVTLTEVGVGVLAVGAIAVAASHSSSNSSSGTTGTH